MLSIVKPVDEDAAYNVNVEFTILPAGTVNHAHVRFTSPERKVKVTDAGEMIWETGHGYWGQWFLYWSE